MHILSIQSSVAYGYAGNTAATFPLQRLGHEVWPIYTVHFSNHTGYGAWRGMVFDPADVAEVVRGVAERGALPEVDLVLTGYQGSPGVTEVVLDAVAEVKGVNPAAKYCCDPVMGDAGRGMYVAPGLPELIRDRVVPAADIVTPNAFELAYLAGSGGDPSTAVPADVREVDGVLAAVETLRSRGPRTVLVTSVEDGRIVQPVAGGCAGPGDTGELYGLTEGAEPIVSMIAVDETGAYRVQTPRLPLLPTGSGDVTTAIFAARLAEHGIERALAETASSMYALMTATLAAARAKGATGAELAVIAAQDAIADPACEFEVDKIGPGNAE